MQARRKGILTRRGGRLTVDGMTIHAGAWVVNRGTVHTYTTISGGTIEGGGTWWARYDTSRPIGGEIDADQIIIYWPFDRRIVLPMPVGGLVSIPKFTGDGGLT